MSLQLATSFLRAISRLTPKEQAAALAVVTAYNSDPSHPGLSLHRVDRARDERLWTARVNRDLRVVLLREGDTASFLFVAHHDEAYRWAERRRLELHPVTGAPQIVEIEEVVRAAESVAALATHALFADEDDDYLLSLGVPPVWLETVRQVDENGLDEILHRLPFEAAEALIELSGGNRPQPGTALPTSDLEQAFRHPDAKRSFWVVTDEDALRSALQRPWAEWAIFLHPSQRIAVESNFRGPARAFGGAGTGKTVVALHRIAWLAARSSGGRLLLTTFSRTLANRLSRDLDVLMDPSLPARERIEVIHLHKLAHALASESTNTLRIVAERELDALIALAGEAAPTVDHAFLRAEWTSVIDYWGLRDWHEYRDADRRGRGSGLSERRRSEVWKAALRLRALMKERGLCTWGDMVDRARTIVEARATPPFHHIVADEAQDFGPREMRLLRALVAQGPRDLFLTGDVGQQIYRWPFRWSAVGIDVRGRSVRLKVNYRTTREIKRFADRLLTAELVDVDGRAAERSSISLLRGPVPEAHRCLDVDAEAAILREWLCRMLSDGVAAAEIGILCRTRSAIAARVAPVLSGLGLTSVGLDDDPRPAIAVGTMHAAKGLEFRAVALIGVEIIPSEAASTVNGSPDVERERHVLYVACTRARDALLITAVGELPPLISSKPPPSP